MLETCQACNIYIQFEHFDQYNNHCHTLCKMIDCLDFHNILVSNVCMMIGRFDSRIDLLGIPCIQFAYSGSGTFHARNVYSLSYNFDLDTGRLDNYSKTLFLYLDYTFQLDNANIRTVRLMLDTEQKDKLYMNFDHFDLCMCLSHTPCN
jgi:hypothetical protein